MREWLFRLLFRDEYESLEILTQNNKRLMEDNIFLNTLIRVPCVVNSLPRNSIPINYENTTNSL